MVKMKEDISYKFNEPEYIQEFINWIEATYNPDYHYSSKIQATENIIDKGHGEGFCMGNIEKLFCRYGKKEGYNRKDLLKIVHYALIMLHVQDKYELAANSTSGGGSPTATSISKYSVELLGKNWTENYTMVIKDGKWELIPLGDADVK